MRPLVQLSLLLLLCVPLGAEEGPAVEAEVAPPAPAEAPVRQQPTRTRLANELVEVELSDWRGSVASIALKGIQPLVLPEFRGVPGRSPEAVAAGGDQLAIVDTFNQSSGAAFDQGFRFTDMNGFLTSLSLREDENGRPLEPLWSRIADGSEGVVAYRHLDEREGIEYTIEYRLHPERPTLLTSLQVRNIGKKSHDLIPKLYAINGIYQDDPTHESYDQCVTAGFGGRPEGMDYWNMPSPKRIANGQLEPLTIVDPHSNTSDLLPSTLDYVGLKSRFFAAYWHPGAVRLEEPVAPVTPAAPEEPVESEGVRNSMDEVLDSSATGRPGAGTDSYRLKVDALGYVQRFASGDSPQAALRVVFKPPEANVFVLKPGATLHLAWSTTVSSLRKEHLALLTPVEAQVQYADAYYRFFRILVKPIEWLLHFLSSILYYQGLAIIVLVILVKAALHRLNFKAQASMAKMQKIAPQLKSLQERYGSDRQQMAMKQMELFKKEGVNPVGGCLPMLLQMPIFIALYQAFRHSADMRGQGFLWVNDLSLPDQLFPLFSWVTLNPLPLLYIAIMLYMGFKTKLPTGPQANEQAAQMQKMMRWLPVIFGVIFYNMPAGLVLYFVISPIIGGLENAWIRKKLGTSTSTMPIM